METTDKIKRTNLKDAFVELHVEPADGWLHDRLTDTYCHSALAKAGEEDRWEWVAEKPAYGKAEYDAEVERLIAERYTTGQEIQFAREKTDAGEKYTEYLEYVEVCKVRAAENLAGVGAGVE